MECLLTLSEVSANNVKLSVFVDSIITVNALSFYVKTNRLLGKCLRNGYTIYIMVFSWAVFYNQFARAS
jgi:hypothetical protein